MTRPSRALRTEGGLYLALCPDGCPLAIWAVEACTAHLNALLELSAIIGLPADRIQVHQLPRTIVRPHYPTITANRDGCPHAKPAGPQ
jgi:hypothetical protein